nr:putative membrane protein [Candidatus Pantoea persica]
MPFRSPACWAQWALHWSSRWSAFFLQVPRDLSSPFISLGYATLILAWWLQLARWRFSYAIQCVGRMALTNYVLQTLICTTLFYRFQLFMHYDRLQLLAFVPAVWLVNILFSLLWLRFFSQGPLEWAVAPPDAAGKPPHRPASGQ